jgi:hypothetical protein
VVGVASDGTVGQLQKSFRGKCKGTWIFTRTAWRSHVPSLLVVVVVWKGNGLKTRLVKKT